MSIFVNYDGPKLDNEQKRVVRSRAMVVVRGRRKQAKCQVKLCGRMLDEERKGVDESQRTTSNNVALQARTMALAQNRRLVCKCRY